MNPADFDINNGVDADIGLPQISITGFNFNIGGPAGFPQGRADTTVVVSDTLNYLRGNHSFKFGGEGRRFYNNNFTLDTGTFTFPNVSQLHQRQQPTRSASRFGDRSSAIIQNAFGFYVQDNFKVRPNVTLELGLALRLEHDANRALQSFRRLRSGNSERLVRVGSGIDKVYEENNKNFQPRVGIAWDPFKDGKTSVRAAYAILTDQPVTNVVTPLDFKSATRDPRAYTSYRRWSRSQNADTVGGRRGTRAEHGRSAASIMLTSNRGTSTFSVRSRRDIGVTIGYFGTKGTHLRISRNINQPINGGVRPFPSLSSSRSFPAQCDSEQHHSDRRQRETRATTLSGSPPTSVSRAGSSSMLRTRSRSRLITTH